MGYVESTAADCHSFYPYFEGLSEAAYTKATLEDYKNATVTYDGKKMPVYDATQIQRGIERRIRYFKRRAEALSVAGLDNTDEIANVRAWQSKMRDFLKQVGFVRQGEREGGKVLINRVP
jgi:hypothetical protein